MMVLKIIIFILALISFWILKKQKKFWMLISGIGTMLLFIIFSLVYFTPLSVGNILLLMSIIISIKYVDNKEKQLLYSFPIWLTTILAYQITIIFFV